MNLALGAAIGLAAYLVGSVPFGLIVARLVAGVDIRRHGSGNIGATNVARVVGGRYGALVLLLDALKGAGPTLVLPRLAASSDSPAAVHLAVVCGLAAIVGHMFPCWLGFRGGKGVATALGVAVVLAPAASLAAFLAFAACFAVSRIVSLSSISASGFFCAFELWQLRPDPFSASTWSLAAFSIAVPLLIVVRHRTNVVRLVRGEEPRFVLRRGENESV